MKFIRLAIGASVLAIFALTISSREILFPVSPDGSTRVAKTADARKPSMLLAKTNYRKSFDDATSTLAPESHIDPGDVNHQDSNADTNDQDETKETEETPANDADKTDSDQTAEDDNKDKDADSSDADAADSTETEAANGKLDQGTDAATIR